MALAAYYLFAVAAPQYASYVGFSVRSEEGGSPVDLLSGLGELSKSSSTDADILYDYTRSQALVAAVAQDLDLAKLWHVPADPVFSVKAAPTIEALHAHWGRKVRVTYDPNSRLITIRALAFAPEDALKITEAAYAESARMINALSDRARRDATAFARTEFDQAQSDLRAARLAVTQFRARTQMVDPSADI
ncbi:MAG: capsule biosynthesis protein, partial [Pseudomonadota bacterium]